MSTRQRAARGLGLYTILAHYQYCMVYGILVHSKGGGFGWGSYIARSRAIVLQ